MNYAYALMGRIQEFFGRVAAGDSTALTILALLIVCAVLFLLVLIRLMSRRTAAAPRTADGVDRYANLGGKLERMERSLNEFRTESARRIEFSSNDVQALSERVERLYELLEQRGVIDKGERPQPARVAPQTFPDEESYDTDLESTADEMDVEEPAASDRELSGEARSDVLVPREEDAATPETEEAPVPESLATRLFRTRDGFFGRIKALFSSKPAIDAAELDELEALLVSSDVGVRTVGALLDEVRKEIAAGNTVDESALTALLKIKVLGILEEEGGLSNEIRPARLGDGPLVVMVVGVNGAGKTTTTAKLAYQWKRDGARVVMVAGDTFRAAAVEQLVTWGERIGVPVVRGAADAKPSTVVFDAMQSEEAKAADVIIIDTAGRLHTKSNLMQELHGIRNIIERHRSGAPHETLLVLDGSTGQNAIAQAREFHGAVPLTGLIITKLDGTPKGGVVVAIKEELGIPVRYIGVGEGPDDVRIFSPRDFVEALFDSSGLSAGDGAEKVSAHGETRRRRRRDTQSYLSS